MSKVADPIVQDEVVINQIQDGEEPEEETGELAVDIYRTTKEIILVAPVAGVDRDNLSIKINENVLIIKGQRYAPPFAGGEYVVQECFWGLFSRMVVLPSKVDVTHVKASFKHGTLVIRIPVIFEPKEKVVQIEED